MNGRENWQALLDHEPTEWIPSLMDGSVAMLGGMGEYWENGPLGGGLDAFGNGWIPTASAGGGVALDPAIVPLDDVCDWEDKVVFPDLDAIDWQAYAESQLAGVDRSQQFLEYHTWNSVFLRFTHLLGFEEGLCAFAEEPEASKALCDAIADYKIALLERVAEYIAPDAYVHYDDFATERGPFIAPEVYREAIKPAHTRMNDAARVLGITPEIHICGHCEQLLDDVIEEGSVAWQSAQPSNDIVGILETRGDRLSVIGGYDTQGRPGAPDVTDDEILDEIQRCFADYGFLGRSYGFIGIILGDLASPEMQRKLGLMAAEVDRLNGR